jgi:hypothetical protein
LLAVFYLGFFFREGEKTFQEEKPVVSNAKTANFGRMGVVSSAE